MVDVLSLSVYMKNIFSQLFKKGVKMKKLPFMACFFGLEFGLSPNPG
jgi:hypothetical protein